MPTLETIPETIPTFRQYVDRAHDVAIAKYGITRVEARQELPDSRYSQEWRDLVVRAFNDGATMPTRLWRSMDEGLRYRVLRSSRALRDNSLTRSLREKAYS